MTAIVLIICVWLANDRVETRPYNMPDIAACKAAEDSLRTLALADPNVIDVGSICVKNAFSEDARPRS